MPPRIRRVCARLREGIDRCAATVGSGLTASNARDFADADGAIAGTSVKRDGAVDATLVEALMRAFKA